MRYRPFGNTGQAVSAVTLSLGARDVAHGPAAACDLIYAALEMGVNAYRLEDANPVLAEVLGQALRSVDRKLVSVGITLGAGDGRRASDRDFSAQGMTGAIDRALHISGLGWFDFALLDEPGEHELPQSSLNALKAMRATERVRLLGVAGGGEVMDAYVSTGAFDVLASPLDVNSPWPILHRLKIAREQDMAIMGYDFHRPDRLAAPPAPEAAPVRRGLFGMGKAAAPAPGQPGAFDFLNHVRGWTAETICLSHALSNPSVSTVLIRADGIERLNDLAQVPDRDLPSGLPAQIEMARIGRAA